jgi:pteridine reductase
MQAMRALVTGAGGKLLGGVVPLLEQRGWQVVGVRSRDGDVATAAGAQHVVRLAVEKLGGLDVLVNGAGAGFRPQPFDEVTEEDLDEALGATVKGSFLVTQAAAPHLRASRGVVVMIEDVAALQPWPSFAAHCAGKAAQAMLTRVLARALAPEVRVVGVAPGPVAVDPEQEARRAAETALGRVGSPADIADAIAYLAGAGFVTGASLVVDGGRLLQSGKPPRA